MRTLGRCEVDRDNQELSFMKDTGIVTLRGDVELHEVTSSELTVAAETEWYNSQLTLFSNEINQQQQTPEEVVQLLANYGAVFAEPTDLLPERGYKHAIKLWEG